MTGVIADAIVDWAALGKGALVAFFGGIGVVAAFSLVVLASSRITTSRRTSGRTPPADVALMAIGGLVCAAALIAGLLAMMHKT